DLMLGLMQHEEKTIFFSTHITSDLEKVADYITFIHDGRILFSLPKDELFERYALVKGGRELLNADSRRLFVGLREHSFGFEGLTADAAAARARCGGKGRVEPPPHADRMAGPI